MKVRKESGHSDQDQISRRPMSAQLPILKHAAEATQSKTARVDMPNTPSQRTLPRNRNSPLTHAFGELEMTHRSICLPDFPQFRKFADPLRAERDERQIGRVRRCVLKQDQQLSRVSPPYICSIRAARFHNHVIFTMLLELIEHVRGSYIRSLKIGVIVLYKSVTDIILTSEAPLKQRQRNKLLRASEFPGCPDFPE